MIELLENKTPAERATIKGKEIAKIGSVTRNNVTFSGADYDIEILETIAIEGGVQVLAKAWDSNGQIGFGKDGTIDIERFNIINPPILVHDDLGDIEKEVITENEAKVPETFIHKYREDPQSALLQSLAHTIKITTENNPRGKIIPGKVGSTTSTFYPDANTIDGKGGRAGTTETWAAGRSGAADTSSSADASAIAVYMLTDGGDASKWDRVRWYSIFGFNTGDTIPVTDTVSSATFSVVPLNTGSADWWDQNVTVDRSVPASPTALANGDFELADMALVEQTSARKDLTTDIIGVADNATYVDWTLNATGIGNIGKGTDVLSWYSLVLSGMFDDVEPGPDALNKSSHFTCYFADQAGTSTDPKLVVVHAAVVAGGVHPTLLLMNVG